MKQKRTKANIASNKKLKEMFISMGHPERCEEGICPACKQLFILADVRGRKRKFCSKKCNSSYKSPEQIEKMNISRKKYLDNLPRIEYRCSVCNIKLSWGSKTCNEHRKPFSKTHRKRLAEALTGKKQSKETLDKLSKIRQRKTPWNKGKPDYARRGAGHHNWKGGLTPAKMIFRNSLETKQWRTSVFHRDDYTCMLCESKAGVLNAHHIKFFANNPDFRLDIRNGITLCKGCHQAVHKHIGYGESDSNMAELYIRAFSSIHWTGQSVKERHDATVHFIRYGNHLCEGYQTA